MGVFAFEKRKIQLDYKSRHEYFDASYYIQSTQSEGVEMDIRHPRRRHG